jgi:hypothetical protein
VKIIIGLCIILTFSLLPAQAKPQYGTVTVSKVTSVYDGDTFRVDIDSLPPIVGKNIPTLGLQSDICMLTS